MKLLLIQVRTISTYCFESLYSISTHLFPLILSHIPTPTHTKMISAHDMKSPTCALGLAVESLLDALDNNKPLSESVRHRVIETLHGMAHTIATVNMIINRSVVRAV